MEQVANSDGGVTLSPEQHKEVSQVAGELQKYCVSEPVKCPLIFGGENEEPSCYDCFLLLASCFLLDQNVNS